MSQSFWVIFSVATGMFMIRMNNYSLNVCLPATSRYFQVGPGAISRTVTAYLVVVTGSFLVFGKVSDRVGPRPVLLWGFVVFAAGSFCCSMAWRVEALIGFRVVQGVGAAMLVSSAYAIVSKFVPQERIGMAYGLVSTAAAAGIAVGAPLGGLISNWLSWKWIFLLNVPVGLAAAAMGLKIPHGKGTPLPEECRKPASGSGGFDVIGAVLSFSGLVFLVFGVDGAKRFGWSSPVTVLTLAVGGGLLALFVHRERTCGQALLDVRSLGDRGLAFELVGTIFAYMAFSGMIFLLPFYLAVVKGFNASQIGFLLLVYALIYVFFSSFAGRLSDKVNPNYLCGAGMLSASVCALTFSQTLLHDGLAWTFVFVGWLGVSYVLFFAPNSNAVMRRAPVERKGSVSGLLNATINLGTVLGLALLQTIFTSASQGLAATAAGFGRTAASRELVLSGFAHAYAVGGLFCTAASACAFIAVLSRKAAVLRVETSGVPALVRRFALPQRAVCFSATDKKR